MTEMTDDEARARMSANIRALLGKRGMSMRTLAAESDTTPMNISRIVGGQQIPSVSLASRIAQALDTSVDFLLREPEKVKVSA